MQINEIPVGKAKNIIGKRYGRLVVQCRVAAPSHITVKKPHSFWLCECDCGNTCIISVDNLNGGNTSSCGCISKEKASERFGINELGNKYGHLTVIKKDESAKFRRLHWLCQCDCGNPDLQSVDGTLLRNGNVIQCSLCAPRSKGEEKIRDILFANNIPFIQEKTFEDCRFPETNRKARFDFFVNNSYIIEFDGRQHIEKTTGSRSNWWSLDYVRSHDTFKSNYCKEKNIPLIRIPYTHLSKIQLEDLRLETSKFIEK